MVEHTHNSWIEYGAALWASIFGLLHILWATGWYIALDPAQARRAFEQPWFLMYDLAVVFMCLAAAGVALAFVRPWGRRVPRWMLSFLALTGTGLLTLRAVGGAIQLFHRVADGSFVARQMDVWEPWFCLGAILFALSTWRYLTARPRSSVAGEHAAASGTGQAG